MIVVITTDSLHELPLEKNHSPRHKMTTNQSHVRSIGDNPLESSV